MSEVFEKFFEENPDVDLPEYTIGIDYGSVESTNEFIAISFSEPTDKIILRGAIVVSKEHGISVSFVDWEKTEGQYFTFYQMRYIERIEDE